MLELENINNADKHLNNSAGFDSISSLACARETLFNKDSFYSDCFLYACLKFTK